MMATFRKWPSIENTYQQQHIDWWLLRHPELAKIDYIITEKLDGANVQICAEPDGEISYGTRNGFASGAALFGWPANAPEVVGNLDMVLSTIKATAHLAESDATLYGEIYGPGVQKGVNYGDSKGVAFFGAKIGDELMPFRFLGKVIAAVPVVATVQGLEAALAYDAEFDSLLSGQENNICEGVVIQPIEPVRDGDSYFLLKKKNEAFKEKQKEKKVRAPDEVVDPLNAAFRQYITEQRMDNVFSREGPIEDKSQIGKYIGLILIDAIGDFTKDYPEIQTLDKKQRKAIFNVGSAVAKMLIYRL